MIKSSLICTLKNEEASICDLLNSLMEQSQSADEIIIVDGGSDDKTIDIIRSFQMKSKLPIILIECKNINIPKGRNVAIKNAKNIYIACIDGGCKADKNWLENLLNPFVIDKSIDVVAGFYLPDCSSPFEEVSSLLIYPEISLIQAAKFLPSGRSIAFKKHCWEVVGGYPELQNTAEDTIFDIKLKENGCNFFFAKDAIVYWRPRNSFHKLYRQYFHYSKGAVLGNISYTIITPYGENLFDFLYKKIKITLLALIKQKKFLLISLIIPILLCIFLGKLFGSISGFFEKHKKRD